MNVRLTFIFGFFLFSLMGEQALLAADAVTPSRPNVVLIISDDHA
jgi:hypothetical protein